MPKNTKKAGDSERSSRRESLHEDAKKVAKKPTTKADVPAYDNDSDSSDDVAAIAKLNQAKKAAQVLGKRSRGQSDVSDKKKDNKRAQKKETKDKAKAMKGSDDESDAEEDEDEDESEEEVELCEVFVGNMPWSSTNESLKELFSKFGEVTNVSIPMSGSKKKGYAFVKFANGQQAKKAADAMNGYKLDDRELKVNLSANKPAPERQPRTEGNNDKSDEKSSTLFVGNLSFQTDEGSLEQFFAKYGSIKSVRIAL